MANAKEFIKKNQKLTVFALAIMVLSLPFIVNQILKRKDTRQRAQTAPAISFQISPASKTVAVNEEFDVDLLMNTNSNDIGAIEFTINYPSSNLQLVSDTPLSTYTVADKQSTAGSYRVTLLNITSTPVNGSNVKVVTLKFKALANGSATVKLNPSNLQVTASGSDQFVPVNNPDQIEASYTVGQVAGGATLSLSPASGTHASGTNFSVQVRVNASEPVNAVEVNIPYSQSLLTVNSITKGDFDIEAAATSTGGTINLAYGNIAALSGDRLVATISFRSNGGGTANLAFTNSQVLSSVTNQNVLTSSTGGTYTLTGGVTPSVSPTATNTPTPTPTRTPTPTNTPTPTLTPTTPPNQGSVNVSVILPGIGLVPGDNTSPQNPNKTASLQIFNSQNQNVANLAGIVTYTQATGRYQGTFSLGSQFTSGNYLMNVKLPNTLSKRIPGIITVTSGSTTNTSAVTLVSGDLSNKNALDITDWTNMVACTRNESGCTAALRAAADLNDDGTVDVKDATILQRGYIIRQGD